MVDEVAAGRWRDAPLFLQVRLEDVCFKVCRTVSCATTQTTSSATSRSASRRRLQRWYPLGGSLHASAIRCASCTPSNVSIVQRKVLAPNDFPDLAAVERRRLACAARDNDTAVPCHRRCTRQQRADRLAALPEHPPPRPASPHT